MWKLRLSIEDMTWINNCYICGGWAGCVHESDPNCAVCHPEKSEHTTQELLDAFIAPLDDETLQKRTY